MLICLAISWCSFYSVLLNQKISETTQSISQVEITQPIQISELSKLPKGWVIVRSTSTGKYRWKDSDDWMSSFNEDTYEDAVKHAIMTSEYRKRKEKEKKGKWKPVNN